MDWLADLESHAQWSFSRSSGPGGQNVNKVNTKVELRIAIESLQWLSGTQRQILRLKLAHRIVDDALVVTVQETRSQLENRTLALARMQQLIRVSLTPRKKRQATKPTRASQERRLGAKKQASVTKRQRSRPLDD